jgi:hypothetical protein
MFFRFDFRSILALALFYWTRVSRKLDCLLSPPRVDDRSDTEYSARFNNIIVMGKPNIVHADKPQPGLLIIDNNNE